MKNKCKQEYISYFNKTAKTAEIMESNNLKFTDDPTVTLTIRLIMQGKVSY